MPVDPKTLHVAVIAGGTSEERDISLASGAGSQEALAEAGFHVTWLDPARPEDMKQLVEGPYDVAFLCMHGKGGEDGTMQGMLEILGIPYTGPGVWSSATAMDKVKSKVFYGRAGIPTPPSVALNAKEGALSLAAAFAQEHGWPIVVKPATEGSALGVCIVDSPDQLERALDEAFALDAEVLVERFVSGREITVAVLGNDEAFALPIIEIVPRNKFYDFESKYAPGGSQHLCPAPLGEELTEQAMNLALATHAALECRGVSRTDMIIDQDGSLWVLETNTLPGMTSTSLLPDAARAAGISFPELCTKLVEYALEEKSGS
ncbi:MAG: D-alanine--D-alanine ligase [Eggerthellaceae bacterium]|nr:D-alanine--D-alanine ligase [Eggerthellaceae bacterium]